MIQLPDAMPILVDACPSFSSAWEAHRAEHGNALHFVAAGEFASHLLVLYNRNATASFPSVALALERLYSEGSPQVREFVTVGVLEGVQNTWSNNGCDPAPFYEYLGCEGKRWWNGLNAFWSGKTPRVGPVS
jgi:hypothetical protein